MAEKEYVQLSAALASALSSNTVFTVQDPDLATPQTRKVVVAQVRQFVLQLAGLTAKTAAQLGENAVFLVCDPDIDEFPYKVTLPQMRTLLGEASTVTFHQEPAKVGATAGWVVGAANDLGKMATLPQNQTSSTLVVPLSGFHVGQTISGFYLTGSIQSGGNTASITADLRMLTAAAAGATDSSLGALAAPVSVTANTVLSSVNTTKSGINHVVAAGESFYMLLTATTGASCTEEVQAIAITTTG